MGSIRKTVGGWRESPRHTADVGCCRVEAVRARWQFRRHFAPGFAHEGKPEPPMGLPAAKPRAAAALAARW